MKQPNPTRFKQDESGQWWYHFGKKNPCRLRTKVSTCPHCKEKFVQNPVGHTQQDGTNKIAEHCSRACGVLASNAMNPERYTGHGNGRWKGGKLNQRGYVLVWAPDHHSIAGRGTKRRYVLEHRIVMERILSRPLLASEHIHHKNGIRDDNRPENLELWVKRQPAGQRVGEQQHCKTCKCFVES